MARLVEAGGLPPALGRLWRPPAVGREHTYILDISVLTDRLTFLRAVCRIRLEVVPMEMDWLVKTGIVAVVIDVVIEFLRGVKAKLGGKQ